MRHAHKTKLQDNNNMNNIMCPNASPNHVRPCALRLRDARESRVSLGMRLRERARGVTRAFFALTAWVSASSLSSRISFSESDSGTVTSDAAPSSAAGAVVASAAAEEDEPHTESGASRTYVGEYGLYVGCAGVDDAALWAIISNSCDC